MAYYPASAQAGPSSQPMMARAEGSQSVASPTAWNVGRRYAVVVDAGSSGSRMQVYSWKDPLIDRTQREHEGASIKVLPKVEKGTWEGSGHDWQLKVEPGLSSFGSHPQDLATYLTPLFDHARTVVPPEALADTPVFVLATAGMRLLPASQQKQVLQNTCDFIDQKTPFKIGVGGCGDHVQIISGEEEGLLGWIAINYLMDGFHFRPTAELEAGNRNGTEGKSTFGFLDMGGASTQIAFEPSQKAQESSPASQDDLTPVSLRMLDGTDVTHNVFVTTFLGFGTNKARERYVHTLASADPTKRPVDDPCLPAGLSIPLNDADLLGIPPSPTTATSASLLGTGSFDRCIDSLSPLLDKSAACSRPPCLFSGVHVPAIDFSVNHFIGVSEYWFSSNDVFKLGGVYDFVSFQKAAQTFCGTSWSQLNDQLAQGTVFGKQVTADRLQLQCFKAAWMATVLHEGIGLPRITDPGGEGEGTKHADQAQDKADAKNLFQSVNDVGGLSVSWTLGKAVLEASKDIPPLPANGPNSAPVHGAFPTDVVPVPDAKHKWQDKFSPAWHRPEALMSGKNDQLPALLMFLLVLISAIGLVVCLLLRGRSAKAVKRRAVVRDLLSCSLPRKASSHGDYTLADMEEGANGHRHDYAVDDVADSDDSGEDIDGRPRTLRSKHKRRRSSGNGILTAVIVPLQRIALAMGLSRSAVSSSHSPPSMMASAGNGNTGAPLSLGQRRHFPMRYPLRHHNTVGPHSQSQPTSPRAYAAHVANINGTAAGYSLSRPASRSGSMLSPRFAPDSAVTSATSNGTVVGGAGAEYPGAHGSYFYPHLYNGGHGTPRASAANSVATMSARSSRAASPSFGLSSNATSNGQLTPTVATFGRQNPILRPSSAAPGFARKAWEDSD